MTRAAVFDAARAAGADFNKRGAVATLDTALDMLGVPRDSDGPLAPSPACAAFLKGYEQCRLRAYMPTPNDRPTIGWGSTGPDIKMGMTWTQEQADARFAADLEKFGKAVAAVLTGHPTTQAQYDAMVSLAYNIGIDGFADSTLTRLHKVGDFDGAAAQFGRWNKQKGVVLNGLTRRRAAEAAIYRGHSA